MEPLKEEKLEACTVWGQVGGKGETATLGLPFFEIINDDLEMNYRGPSNIAVA